MAATGTLIPASVNLSAIVGADFSATIQLFQDVAETTAFDLTGYTVSLAIGGALLVLTSGSGLTIATPANGTIVAVITAAQSAALQGAQHYTLKLTDGSGLISFPLSGTLTYAMP